MLWKGVATSPANYVLFTRGLPHEAKRHPHPGGGEAPAEEVWRQAQGVCLLTRGGGARPGAPHPGQAPTGRPVGATSLGRFCSNIPAALREPWRLGCVPYPRVLVDASGYIVYVGGLFLGAASWWPSCVFWGAPFRCTPKHPPGAGGTGQWRGYGAGCRHFFFLAWGGTGVARACPVPPGPPLPRRRLIRPHPHPPRLRDGFATAHRRRQTHLEGGPLSLRRCGHQDSILVATPPLYK
eukprot:gene13297-biopygen23035